MTQKQCSAQKETASERIARKFLSVGAFTKDCETWASREVAPRDNETIGYWLIYNGERIAFRDGYTRVHKVLIYYNSFFRPGRVKRYRQIALIREVERLRKVTCSSIHIKNINFMDPYADAHVFSYGA